MRQLLAYTKSQSTYMPYGACIVGDDEKPRVFAIAQPENNPILHAEINAINQYAAQYPDSNWRELTLYTTAEPCPMCASACCWAGFKQVVYASNSVFLARLWKYDNPLISAANIRAAFIFDNIPNGPKLTGGICEQEANQLFIAYKNNILNFLRKHVWHKSKT